MSLVGPRPERPELARVIEEDLPEFALRKQVKPGITGWAQVKYRYTGTIEEARYKLELDIQYISKRGIPMDMHIIALTLLVVLRRDGS